MYPKPLTPPKKYRRQHLKLLHFGLIAALVVGLYAAIALARPFAELRPSHASNTLTITTPASNLPWPSYGESAFGLDDGKIIAAHGDQTPLPTASTAKIITALLVLKQHPLRGTESGPSLTMSANDVTLYKAYITRHGSIVPIFAGEQLTERQMLEAMMLPSGNNIADSLAIWAYGSLDAYRTAATTYLKQHNITNTHIGSDASGLSPDTTSTATDLVKIGALAMQNSAIANVVSQKAAVIPGVGIVSNVDTLLGANGIVGIKTGNNDQNPGVFVGAAKTTVNGKVITMISTISGGPSLTTVLGDSNSLLTAAATTIANTAIIKQGSVLGTYTTPGGDIVQAVAADDLSTVILRGDSIDVTIRLNNIGYSARAGQVVGTASLPATDFDSAHGISIILKQAPTKPSLKYRLLHP